LTFDGSGEDLVTVAAIKSSEKTATSVTKINELFHRKRRWRENGEVKGFFGNRFCTGEPVVHGRNDADTGLSNGSIGTVTALDQDAASVTAAFDGNEHAFGPDVLIDLELAYAMTCHRLQGSSARRVIVPLVGGEFLDPSWIYTAITRAEQQAVLVGTRAELDAILARPFRHAARCVHFSLDPEPPPISTHEELSAAEDASLGAAQAPDAKRAGGRQPPLGRPHAARAVRLRC
jgi:exodeoxyribonuclease V alpha subunit